VERFARFDLGGTSPRTTYQPPAVLALDASQQRRRRTSNGVEVTARQAYELSFNVTLATDAMNNLHADAHAYSVTRIFPRIREIGTTPKEES
jgi:Isochorismatase family